MGERAIRSKLSNALGHSRGAAGVMATRMWARVSNSLYTSAYNGERIHDAYDQIDNAVHDASVAVLRRELLNG